MPLFTAELGANWFGDLKVLDRMVKNCAEANVDYVKLQCLSKDLIDRHPELKYYPKCSVSEDNIEEIDNICKKHGMEWYSTITDVDQIPLLSYYTGIGKIRVADSNNSKLVQAVFDGFEKVFISSTNPLTNIPSHAFNLYCIPKYPTEFGEVNFDMIKRFDGYSNHCKNPLAILRATRMGASFIEFHLTDSSDTFALDNKVSFSYEEMKEFIPWSRTTL